MTRKKALLKTIINLYDTPFMKAHLEREKQEKWLENLKMRYDKMDEDQKWDALFKDD